MTVDIDNAELASELLLAYVTAVDEEAAVNASIYRRGRPFLVALRTELLAEFPAHTEVGAALRRLGDTPDDDAGTHRRVGAALAARLERDATARARLTRRLRAWRDDTLLGYHLGPDYRRPTGRETEGLRTPETVRALLANSPNAPALSKPPASATGDAPVTAVVIPVRVHPQDPARARNALAAVASAAHQTLARSSYRIVVVEQDVTPRLRDHVADLVDEYVFAVNPGAFNKSWALNLGAAAVPDARTLCFHDADMLVDPDHLRRVVQALENGPPALLPYGDLLFLDRPSSVRAIGSRFGPAGSGLPQRLRGFTLADVNGGYVCVTRELFDRVGGYDERFRGWGDEDNEFYREVCRHTAVPRWEAPLLHMWHPRPPMVDTDGRRANHAIAHTPRPENPGPTADPDKYRAELAGAGGRSA